MADNDNAMVPVESAGISAAAVLERVVISGDLSKLTPVERVAYYARTCESLGLNPLTRPFDYIWLGKNDDRKLTLYAKRDATDQIRRNLGIAILGLDYPTGLPDGLFGVVARARDRFGREDSATGIVSVKTYDGKPLFGENLANALMKAETKAKRRVTLSLAGLGVIDESEVQSIPDASFPTVSESGVIEEPPATVGDLVAARVEALEPPRLPTADEVTEAAAALAEPEPEGLTETAAEPVAESEPAEAPSVPSDGLSLESFAALVAEVDRDTLRAVAHEMFPDASGFRQLSDAQRWALWLRVKPEPVPAAEAPADEEELLASVMSAEESATLPARCGDPSPYSDSTCSLAPEHKGRHLAGTNESW